MLKHLWLMVVQFHTLLFHIVVLSSIGYGVYSWYTSHVILTNEQAISILTTTSEMAQQNLELKDQVSKLCI